MFADSRDVAATFGKQHHHVLDFIRDLVAKAPSLGVATFRETPFTNPQNGQTYAAFLMDRDGFSLLVMGFTGEKALRWKLRYIEAFSALRGLLLTYTEKVIALIEGGVLNFEETSYRVTARALAMSLGERRERLGQSLRP